MLNRRMFLPGIDIFPPSPALIKNVMSSVPLRSG